MELVNKFMPSEIKIFQIMIKGGKIIPVIKERIEKFGDIKDMHKRGELKYFLNNQNMKQNH